MQEIVHQGMHQGTHEIATVKKQVHLPGVAEQDGVVNPADVSQVKQSVPYANL